jgi:hypothetical protein
MASNLYDSGKPQRVEHVVKVELDDDSISDAVVSAIRKAVGKMDAEAASRGRKSKPVTITPQFERVEERKRLK